MRIKVLRTYWSNGKLVPVDSVVTVEDPAGRGLIASGKAERVDEDVAPPSGPMTTESVPDLVSGPKKRGKKGSEDATS